MLLRPPQRYLRRKEPVKAPPGGVKKPYGPPFGQLHRPTFAHMSIVVFTVLTLAVFALLGFVQRVFER